MNKYNIQELEEKIIKSKNVKIDDVSIDDIDKISEIKISKKRTGNERILDYIKKVTNPYLLNINGRIVKIEFTNNGKSAEECISNVLSKVYK